jgi:hypothetical protein
VAEIRPFFLPACRERDGVVDFAKGSWSLRLAPY